MNKKILETRLRSIEHYDNEAINFYQAYETTQKTRDEIVHSLVEFCTLKAGDMILWDGEIMKIENVIGTSRYNKKVRVDIKIRYPKVDGYNRQAWSDPIAKSIHLEDLDKVKIISE